MERIVPKQTEAQKLAAREAVKRYLKTPKGQAMARAWRVSKKGQASQKRYRKSPERKEAIKRYNNSKKRVQAYRQRTFELKLETLTHYGLNGKLQCCWPECTETDIDVLTLDHINNDGAKDRRGPDGIGGGLVLYKNLRKRGYPEGFQTLCANHQLKKEILRRRKETDMKYGNEGYTSNE